MKKLAIILGTTTALAFAAQTAQAQTSLRFGVKGGLNGSHATLKVNDEGDKYSFNSLAPGFHVGGLAELSFPRGSKFKLQLEALYNMNFHNFKSSEPNVDNIKVTHGIIQVPLSVRYFIQPDFSINAGLSANYNLMIDDKEDTPNLNDFTDIKPIQLGAHIGATYYINKGFFIEGRYDYTFGSALENKFTGLDIDYNYGTIQLGVGYKFK